MKTILGLAFASRLLFLVFALLAVFVIPLRVGYLGNQLYPGGSYFTWIWANFDGRHFLDIADLGYRKHDFAFFPLYPLLIYMISKLLYIPSIYAGVAISFFSFILAMVMIYKIVRLDYDNHIANLTLLLISFFPLAFYYHSAYADSLFLLFSTSSFYFARKGNWFWSGIFGGLTVLTRLSGVSLIPALAVEWYLQNKKSLGLKGIFRFLKTGGIALVLTGSGLLIYLAYLQIFYGDFLLFQKSMSAWQQHNFILPPQTLFRYIKILLFVDKSLLVYWVAVFELATLVFYLYLTWYTWKYIRISYGIFMLVLLSLIAFTGTFAGTPRYMLHLFPGFLALALIVHKYTNTALKVLVMLIYIVLGFILTGLFTRGYFIA